MTYTLLIKNQAKKMLQSLPRPDRTRITEKIMLLGSNSDNPGLDINLRVGQWRIIFGREDEVKIISIEKIKSRGDVYK